MKSLLLSMPMNLIMSSAFMDSPDNTEHISDEEEKQIQSEPIGAGRPMQSTATTSQCVATQVDINQQLSRDKCDCDLLFPMLCVLIVLSILILVDFLFNKIVK
jgi:hypothetical protein